MRIILQFRSPAAPKLDLKDIPEGWSIVTIVENRYLVARRSHMVLIFWANLAMPSHYDAIGESISNINKIEPVDSSKITITVET